MKINYQWDLENGIANCIITYKEYTFQGQAECHPEDMEFVSEKTGYIIAETRATINLYQHIINNDIKPALNALVHLYSNIKTSKKYNPKSYEAKCLRRQIHVKQKQLDTTRQEIAALKQDLKTLIEEKDKFYNKIRTSRNKDENNQ